MDHCQKVGMCFVPSCHHTECSRTFVLSCHYTECPRRLVHELTYVCEGKGICVTLFSMGDFTDTRSPYNAPPLHASFLHNFLYGDPMGPKNLKIF